MGKVFYRDCMGRFAPRPNRAAALRRSVTFTTYEPTPSERAVAAIRAAWINAKGRTA